MRCKISHAKWGLVFLLFVIINVHISLMIIRLYDKANNNVISQEGDLHAITTSSMNGAAYGNDVTRNSKHIHRSMQTHETLSESGYSEEESQWAQDGEVTEEEEVSEAQQNTADQQQVQQEKLHHMRRVKKRSSTDMNTTSSEHTPKLPAFAVDDSEFIFSSMIERVFDSFDLFLTTFMMSHFMLEPKDSGSGVDKVHPAVRDNWKHAIKKFADTQYYPSGMRDLKPPFFCKISNSAGGPSYTVTGLFVPNRLTSDSNSNRRLDILRCKMQGTKEAYRDLIRTSKAVHVEIFRESTSLINFTVPWDTRRTGYILANPSSASKLDPWKGYDAEEAIRNAKNESYVPMSKGADNLYICTTGIRQIPSKRNLPGMIEFVSHHLLVGADHVFLPISLDWKSPHMERFMTVFGSYIDEGKVTIGSQTGDGIDMVLSIGGLTWQRNNVKIFQANMCLFLAKGLAEYVIVQDTDEFMVPLKDHKTIMDVIRAVDSPQPLQPFPPGRLLENIQPTWKGGRGWSDGDAHPFCYLTINSDVVTNRRLGSFVDPLHPWLGARFTHGPEPRGSKRVGRFSYKRAILPTRRIYQAGLNMGGACLLPDEWTECKKAPMPYCGVYTQDHRRFGQMKNGVHLDFRDDHNFYELVTEKDTKVVNPDTEMTMYHFLIYHDTISASMEALYNQSVYATKFYPAVLEDIRSRGLEILVTLPDVSNPPPTLDEQWTKLFSAEDVKEAELYRVMKKAKENPQLFKKLPNNFSTRSYEDIVELPNFTKDFTDYAIGGLIERVSDSYDLWLTTFFLCHWLLEPKVGGSAIGGEKISPEVIDVWKRAMLHFEKTKYFENGMRESPPFFQCRIRHTKDSVPYVVNGHFVPNKLTPDSNSNRRLDIFRCQMRDTQKAYEELARHPTELLYVDILSDGVPVLSYTIPWLTRKTGFMYSVPFDATKYDSWKGYDKNTPGIWTHDNFVMCVPGWETPPSKMSLPLYLEFVQHHLLLGVDHFFLAALFSWDSVHMQRLLRVLRSYINEGKVSIASSTADGFDLVYSTGGLQWGRDNVKNFYVNMCTYFSRGTAEYVGVWDYDEHFWPRGSNNNIMDVVRAMESPKPIPYLYAPGAKNYDVMPHWRGGRGLADNDGHPFCYLILNSVVTLFSQAHTAWSPEKPWIGERFSHGAEPLGHGLGFKKSIRPTRKIFQGGLHMAGACRLEWPWNGCDNATHFCFGQIPGQQYRLTKFPNGSAINFNLNHRFDEIVLDQDAKVIDPETEAVINHLQYHRFWFGASEDAVKGESEYTNKYFPSVIAALDKRNLQLPITLPEKAQKPFPEPDDTKEWTDVMDIHLVINGEPSGEESVSKKAEAVLKSTIETFKASGGANEKGKVGEVKSEAPTYTSILPELASDSSEFFLSSIIERVSDSYDLYLTTFLLAHVMLESDKTGNSAHKVNFTSLDTWTTTIMKFKEAQYLPNGRRSRKPKFFCKISNYNGGTPYIVEGDFVPNRLTPDVNANRRLDILRCKMEDTETAYMELARHKKESVYVEILRGEGKSQESLISFKVPWLTRVQGKMLETTTESSRFDMWKGFNAKKPGEWSSDRLYMCVPGLESPPSRRNLPVYLEFIQHHLNMGVEHFFLTAFFTWESVHMKRLLRVFKSYIDDDLISMTSHSTTDNTDFLYSMRGMSWNRDTVKIFQVNMCVYLAKGVTDYVGVWDMDEFFIPRGNNKNIIDAIRNAEALTPPVRDTSGVDLVDLRTKWKGGRGMADGDAHPFCYLQLMSNVIANKEAVSEIDMNHPWVGERFAHGEEPVTTRVAKQFSFKKQILPTRTMFQIGLHMSGACKLPKEWNGCNDKTSEYCWGDDNEIPRRVMEDSIKMDHRFDEVVMDGDAKRFDTKTEALLFHYMIFRFYHATVNEEVFQFTNDYTKYHFNNTLKGLEERDLDLLITLPDEIKRWPTPDEQWTAYDIVWESRASKTLFPGSGNAVRRRR